MTTIFVPRGGYRQTKAEDYCDLQEEYVSDLMYCRNNSRGTCTTDCIFWMEKEEGA